MKAEDLTELDADEVSRVWINSSNVSVYTDDGVVRLRGILGSGNDYRYVSFNGAEIHTTCSTYDPAIEITDVDYFEYRRLEYEGDVEEEKLKVNGGGNIRQ